MTSTHVKGAPSAPSCVVCGSSHVQQFLDLGSMELANNFLAPEELDQEEPSYPLRVGFCHNCTHVQLMEHVPPSALFDNYLYISSASDTLKNHLYELADIVTERHRLGPDDLVLDIGSNDGTLLSRFKHHGVKVLGVEPARNLVHRAATVGVETYTAFFGSQTSQDIVRRCGRASVITATNTFPHIPDLTDFLAGIKTVLAPGGTFVIEAHYLADFLDQGAFDTIYHEHVSFWALAPMVYLFKQHGMQVVDVERLPIHHGQLRAFVQRQGEGVAHPSVARLLEWEQSKGLGRFDTYQKFHEQAHEIRQNLQRTVRGLLAQGKRVVGYGAPAKASTLLGFLGIGPAMVEYIADRSPLKQGRYTPGTHIPIVAPERLLADQPDHVLLLAWNFADEIMAQQAEYRRRGGRFILPVPEVRIV